DNIINEKRNVTDVYYFSLLVRGPNTENFEKKFYRQCELGCGPQQREIGFPISTDNASWRGPNIEAGGKSAYNNVQVGVGQR
ncbi:hypothetical protein NYS94_07690, partial [Staphylococcus aureus]|uniref:hypothetical protein n=2 Tax=Staphylococcus aureus TaxID=1280 RepID=UPI0021760B8C